MLKILLSVLLGLMAVGLIYGLYLFADIYSDTRWCKHMVGEWGNVQHPSRPHLFIRESGNVMMVREGIDGGEIAAKKDDSGHVLMVNKQSHVNYYTLVYLGNSLFSDGPIRFNGGSTVFGMDGARGWEYKRID